MRSRHGGTNKSDSRSWRKLVMRNRPICFVVFSLVSAASPPRERAVRTLACVVIAARSCKAGLRGESKPIIVSATRTDIPLDQSPASVSVITSEDLDQKQIERVSDALREVPGLSVVQTGTPGQLTSVFTRGLRSEHTQVLLDGIPINQGLAGLFDFANLTTDDIDRIEVVRGPQSTLYGPRALAGVIQIFTKQGGGTPGITLSAEGGSYDTFRETLQSDGKIDKFDYSIGASRLDTDNARPNNQYRNSAAIANVGWSPNEQLRIGSLFTYSLSDTGNPNTIFDPKPLDNFLTEKWLIAPHVDLRPGDWWEHKFIFSYDHERQLNDPNQDGFVGPTRALFERTTVDYQNDLRPTSWLTLTSGFFYSRVNAGQERPFVSQAFGPQPTFISDHTEETAGFLQATVDEDRQSDFRRRRTLRSFQSIRRRLDLSIRRQLQDRQDEHDAAFERRDRIQSAEQSGQNFREQLRIAAGKRFRLGRRRRAAALGKSSHDRRDLFSQRLVERDRVQRTVSKRSISARRERRELKRNCARSRLPILLSPPATPIWMRRRLRQPTFRSRKVRVCHDGHATKSMFPAPIFGGKNCARRSQRSL